MTSFSTAAYHDERVAHHASAARAAAVSCPHCPTLVVPSRMAEHMAFHHPDIVLTPDERELLRAYEADIEDGLSGLERMARALFNVRERKLYREQYKTFAAYCKERWGRSRQWGNNFAVAAGVIDFLSTFVDAEQMPVRESQVRFLNTMSAQVPDGAMLSQDFVARVWTLAVNTTRHSSPDEVTVPHLERVFKVIDEAIATNGHVDPGTGESEPVSPVAFKAAVLADEVETRLRQLDHIHRNSKRERVLSTEAVIHKFAYHDDCEMVVLRLPKGTDTAAIRAAYFASKPVFVSAYVDKETTE